MEWSGRDIGSEPVAAPRGQGRPAQLGRWRAVSESGARTQDVIEAAPTFDHDLRLTERVEDLLIEQFAAPMGIEALGVSVVPRAGGRDLRRPPADGRDPGIELLDDGNIGNRAILYLAKSQTVGRLQPQSAALPIAKHATPVDDRWAEKPTLIVMNSTDRPTGEAAFLASPLPTETLKLQPKIIEGESQLA